jgi:ATP-dependent helicase HrpB
MFREPLPVDDVLPQIVKCLRSAGAVVLKAEPGAGKTTRVPPAILDAGLAKLPDGKPGEIVVMQPRRVAARAAAARIADERGCELGEEIGYQVRFEKRFSCKTRILVCTEGVFLRRLQADPFLERTAVVVFDEFHERSLDGDLALAMVAQLRRELRPDLRIVVMSATLDSGPVSRYLGGCPAVECPGRVHPVDIEYLPFASLAPSDRQAADSVGRLLKKAGGDILVFLPGVGEIRQTQILLEASPLAQECVIMPLYGEMPLEEQRRVLAPCSTRKIVLATNVAETSLTINGVTAVVDSGLARVNRLDLRLGLNRLQVCRISQASAKQRAGRAGRTAAGVCLRLWSEREHHGLNEFEAPEILRVELSQCLLQVLFWGERDLYSFPWFEAPAEAAVKQALELLERLDATKDGQLSELGRRMACLPLQPRLARLLLEGERLGCRRRAALAAALISERDPFRRPEPRSQAQHQSDSDLLDRLLALEDFGQTGNRQSWVGEILAGPARQVLRAADQLLDLSESRAVRQAVSEAGQIKTEAEEAILQTLVAAFPDRVCKRREPGGRRAVMVGGRGVRLADESAVACAELFVAVELLDTGQSESMVRQASRVERGWLPDSQLQTGVDVVYDSSREKVMAMKRSRFGDLLLSETATAVPADVDPGSVLAEALIARSDLSTLVDEEANQYLLRLQCLRQWMPQLGLPDLGEDPLRELLSDWCAGCASLAELRAKSLVPVIQSRLTYAQITELERQAPERIALAGGRRVKLFYEPGKPPVLAARIQEFFGMKETPRIAGSRVAVLLHLLAPNYRVQQITPDLASFWKNTYEEVRKELKGRYPKHAWPADPLTAQVREGKGRQRQS